jgi:hypothetical protein
MAQGQRDGGNAPDFIAYHVPDRRNAPWVRIGAAWPHQRGGGYSLKIDLIPFEAFKSGELNIQLRKPDPKGQPEAEADLSSEALLRA